MTVDELIHNAFTVISPFSLGLGAVCGIVMRKPMAAVVAGLAAFVAWLLVFGVLAYFVGAFASMVDKSYDPSGWVLLLSLFMSLQAVAAALVAQWLVRRNERKMRDRTKKGTSKP